MFRSALTELLCRTSFFLVTISVTLPACASGASVFGSKDAVPDWVKAAVSQPAKIYPPETPAVVLLDETTLTVGSDGKAVEHRRRVVKILRPQGRDEGRVYLPFDKDRQIVALHVWSIGPDGHEYAVKDNEMTDEIGLPGDGSLYADVKFRVANPPGRDPGGVVAFESEQKMRPYVHETTWEFQDELPRVSQSFTLELPAGYTYGTTWAHHAETKAIDLEHQRYKWEMPETPGIDLDRVPMHPSLEALSGRMTVYYAPGGSAETLATWTGCGDVVRPTGA